MANHISFETKIKRRRGKGTGKAYKPWFKVGEKVSTGAFKGQKSRGNGHRIKGLKTKRIHHLLSNHEKMIFIVLDLNPKISDIREQFPLLDVDLAKTISRELGIEYPNHGDNHILTSDFFIDYKDGQKEVITFKPLSNLSNRQLELFQIEKSYWDKKGVPWKLMTDKDIPKSQTLLQNYLDIYYSVCSFHNKDFLINSVQEFYTYLLINQRKQSNQGLVDFCVQADINLQYEDGLSLRVLKFLLGKQIIKADCNQNIFSNEESIGAIKILKNVKHIDKSALAA